MAHKSSLQVTGSSQVNRDRSDSTFEIKIKTQYLETYSFRVRKNMPISALKREILSKIGFPVEVQRLLYRGRLLRDNQLMSELNIRDGDTMHLVEMQSVPFQPTFPTVVTDASRTSSRQGAGAESSLNTSRIQSGNLTNVGLICQNQASSSTQFDHMASWPTIDENESFHDALTTISDFIDRMKGEFEVCSNSLNNNQLQRNATPDLSDAGILITTPVFLSQVLDRTGRLLRDSATTAISHLSRSLQRIDSNPDQVLRGQIQFGAMQLGLATQHLGAMLLELGRTTMSVVIGQSPGESYVNAGCAVYISPTGLNPILFQQYPYQSWYPYGPVHYRGEQPVPSRSASQVFDSTISRRPPSGSNSAPSLGTQATACIPNELSCRGNTQVQNSSNATQGFHAVLSSGTQSNLSSSSLQPSGLFNHVLQRATQMTLNELSYPEVLLLDRGNDWVSGVSENVGVAEDGRRRGSGENNVYNLAVSREADYQVDLGQAVERSEQFDIRRNIFGEALLRAIDQYGECEVYADLFQLGGIQFANVVLEALENYTHS